MKLVQRSNLSVHFDYFPTRQCNRTQYQEHFPTSVHVGPGGGVKKPDGTTVQAKMEIAVAAGMSLLLLAASAIRLTWLIYKPCPAGLVC